MINFEAFFNVVTDEEKQRMATLETVVSSLSDRLANSGVDERFIVTVEGTKYIKQLENELMVARGKVNSAVDSVKDHVSGLHDGGTSGEVEAARLVLHRLLNDFHNYDARLYKVRRVGKAWAA